MKDKEKPPVSIREMLVAYGFTDPQIKLVVLGINIVTSHQRARRIVDDLVKAGL